MPAVTGRFAEARLYLVYCAALLHPGRSVPTFAQASPVTIDLDTDTDDEYALLIEEGRRQIDRQMADLERIRNRAGALATISLALTAAVVTKTADVLQHHWILIALWAVACALAVLAVAGAASVLSARAVFGGTDTQMAAQGPRPIRRYLAEAYAENVAMGEETVRTFLTVFRDAVTLTVSSALAFLLVLAVLAHSPGSTVHEPAKEAPCPTSTTCSATPTPK
ncbi:hypothetical protein OH768_53945 [Streptomyces sp. NBC_01622]|uniref:hypothetical protein n=1 Tax=Streptomyces sp. NBC_01622 TaxID=2975903 RepID=UPI00386EE277|nr:hypothetical protein OH768_53945 [Streptomyces sp. NBC_01622]